ncbi:O-antigen ligase family protein [Acidobacteriota bacterium]
MSLFLVYLLILVFPLDIWAVFTIGGRGVKLFWIVGLLLIFVFVVNVCLGRQRVKITLPGKAIIIFNIVALLSIVKLITVSASTLQWLDFLSEWLQLVLYTLLFFVITSLSWTRSHVITLLKLWVSVAVVLSLYGIYQIFARFLDLPLAYLPFANPSLDGGLFTRSGPPIGAFYRISSVFIEPAYFAGYLLSPLLFVAILWMLRKEYENLSGQNKIALLGALITLFVAFSFAFSMAVSAVLAGVIAVALFNKSLTIQITKCIAVAFLIIVALSFALKPVFKDNFAVAVFERTRAHFVSPPEPEKTTQPASPYAKTSVGNRTKRARAGLEVWKRSPIIGVGLNNFSYYFPEDVKGLIHNGVIQILAELGLLGLVAFGFVLGSVLLSIRKSLSRLSNFPEKVFIIAFYYILWARVFHFFIALNWIRNTIWMDISMAVLLLHWLHNQKGEANSKISVPSHQISETECQKCGE